MFLCFGPVRNMCFVRLEQNLLGKAIKLREKTVPLFVPVKRKDPIVGLGFEDWAFDQETLILSNTHRAWRFRLTALTFLRLDASLLLLPEVCRRRICVLIPHRFFVISHLEGDEGSRTNWVMSMRQTSPFAATGLMDSSCKQARLAIDLIDDLKRLVCPGNAWF